MVINKRAGPKNREKEIIRLLLQESMVDPNSVGSDACCICGVIDVNQNFKSTEIPVGALKRSMGGLLLFCKKHENISDEFAKIYYRHALTCMICAEAFLVDEQFNSDHKNSGVLCPYCAPESKRITTIYCLSCREIHSFDNLLLISSKRCLNVIWIKPSLRIRLHYNEEKGSFFIITEHRDLTEWKILENMLHVKPENLIKEINSALIGYAVY